MVLKRVGPHGTMRLQFTRHVTQVPVSWNSVADIVHLYFVLHSF